MNSGLKNWPGSPGRFEVALQVRDAEGHAFREALVARGVAPAEFQGLGVGRREGTRVEAARAQGGGLLAEAESAIDGGRIDDTVAEIKRLLYEARGHASQGAKESGKAGRSTEHNKPAAQNTAQYGRCQT